MLRFISVCQLIRSPFVGRQNGNSSNPVSPSRVFLTPVLPPLHSGVFFA